jgi:hypothetical protein
VEDAPYVRSLLHQQPMEAWQPELRSVQYVNLNAAPISEIWRGIAATPYWSVPVVVGITALLTLAVGIMIVKKVWLRRSVVKVIAPQA